jgi:CTP synthase
MVVFSFLLGGGVCFERRGENVVKYIFVTGGVVSGLGKGICAASLGRLLKERGISVRNQKFDPYLNVDPGTMSPLQHGEVFVTEDGAETDLDLGHYERFVDENLSARSSVSAGQIYWEVLSKEREGDFLGKTVQIIPNITEEIKKRIYQMEEENCQVVICEIGGTVGDIESQPFLESIRQVALEKGRENVLYLHVSLIVAVPGTGELKSKPTQHSVKELLRMGIQPDILVCRTDKALPEDMREKIALFCNVEKSCVIENRTAESLYAVPLLLAEEGLDGQVCRKLKLSTREPDLSSWRDMVKRTEEATEKVTIAMVGKYNALEDSYLSVVEAIKHGGACNGVKTEIRWVDAECLTRENMSSKLENCHGILVPGGFGMRAVEGMILAAQFARENQIPYLGICLGMQIAVMEFARNVAGKSGAHSTEFVEDTPHPVIHLMEEQQGISSKGATMRLGAYPCVLQEGSRVRRAYGKKEIMERHRHRYEANNAYREEFSGMGLIPVGLSPDERLLEIVELAEHPWYVGTQFHPELKSRPNDTHPLFRGFIEAAVNRKVAVQQ